MSSINKKNSKKYYIKGIHCASCEILIEKELTNHSEIKGFRLLAKKKEVEIDFHEKVLSSEEIGKLFSGQKYVFSEKPFDDKFQYNKKDYLIAFGIAIPLIIIFILLNKNGASTLVLTAGSSLIIFFIFGVVASFSTCAALVGGIVLSMSKQWHSQFSKEDSFIGKIKPHILFNFGRIISFVLLGALLGVIGSKIQISFAATSVFVIFVSLIMILFGFQMLGINILSSLGFSVPKFIKKFAIESKTFKSQKTPFFLGALTVFLPCGFTITVQGIALLSGSAFSGALAMLIFVLGTTPVLLAIGASSVKFYENRSLATKFSGVAGILVLFFALFNINAQLNVLGYPSFSDINLASESKIQDDFKREEVLTKDSKKQKNVSTNSKKNSSVEMIDGKQVVSMQASSRGYSPNFFEVEAGIPVKWEITDVGTSGCTNAIIAKDFFDGEIALIPGKTVTKEFTPLKAGNYKFSCWMGMVSGTIRVIDGEKS